MMQMPSIDGLHSKAKKMKKAFAMLLVVLSMGTTFQALAGSCQHDWDTASDGSRCGGRSADSRPGGEGSR